MRQVTWDISAGAMLLFALAYFFDGSGLVSAAVPAVCAHELGHIAALRLCHHPLRRVSVGLFGLEIDYVGHLDGARAALCIGAGPFAGLLYAVLACSLGTGFWRVSGAASFVLTAFNLLPILPLDGGRLTEAAVGAAVAAKLSRIAAALLTLGGAVIALRFHALSLLGMGAWLTVCNFRT